MRHAFQSTWIGRPRRRGVGTAWLLAACSLVVAGCRNNSAQTDLVQREMRHQEDQIYALQDYLSEYQQLLCQARAENEALRQQVVRDQFRDEPPTSDDAPPTPPSAPRRPKGSPPPEIEIKDNLEMTLPEVPPLEAPATPEPPPLESSSGMNHQEESEAEAAEAPPKLSAVVTASHSESVPPKEKVRPKQPSASAMVVRAEVSRGEEKTDGPRVLVDVLPLAADGQPVAFEGPMSLMFLDPSALGNAKQLCRWDFAASELAELAHDTSHGPTLVFPLQLPHDVITDRPVELWVRLAPKDGKKVLARLALELDRPGRFVFDERRRKAKAKYPVRTAAAERPRADSRRSTPRRPQIANDGWQVARPGDTPTESTAVDDDTGQWRTATQPIPIVESRPAVPDPLDSYEPDDRYGIAPTTEAPARAIPKWLPERPRVASPPVDHILSPPAWSATR